jgi:NTE family protein
MDRQLDLLLTSQSVRCLEALRREQRMRHHLRALARALPADRRSDPEVRAALEAAAPGAEAATTLLLLSHKPVPHDVEMRSFDYSRPVLTERWDAGSTDMGHALDSIGGRRAGPGEFAVHAF